MMPPDGLVPATTCIAASASVWRRVKRVIAGLVAGPGDSRLQQMDHHEHQED